MKNPLRNQTLTRSSLMQQHHETFKMPVMIPRILSYSIRLGGEFLKISCCELSTDTVRHTVYVLYAKAPRMHKGVCGTLVPRRSHNDC